MNREELRKLVEEKIEELWDFVAKNLTNNIFADGSILLNVCRRYFSIMNECVAQGEITVENKHMVAHGFIDEIKKILLSDGDGKEIND